MSRHTPVYDSVMRMLCAVALCPQLRPILFENSEQQSLKSLLYKLKDCVDTYVSKLELVFLFLFFLFVCLWNLFFLRLDL